MSTWEVIEGDCLTTMRGMPAGSADCCVSSPPYWSLRDYGVDGQIGLEETPEEYVARIVEVFREVRRVLTDCGGLWLNIGDKYANDAKWGGATGGKHAKGLHGKTAIGRCKVQTGLPAGELIGLPWMTVFALRADGWRLRSSCIWHKPNAQPEPVDDRPSRAYEHVFLLVKSRRYWYDAEAVREPCVDPTRQRHDRVGGAKWEERQQHSPGGLYTGGETRNLRDVWSINTQQCDEAHFAVYPEKLVEICIRSLCPPGGVVLDPFTGSGTTGLVAMREGRSFVGCELNGEYAEMARRRIAGWRHKPIRQRVQDAPDGQASLFGDDAA